ncbi:MAG TPA: thiol-disulfide oxidoreductase [Cyanothece sp. UBA12306]|nr:thiol-disulfide oxidoreductase [Cyanothece sp. UBA12306]
MSTSTVKNYPPLKDSLATAPKPWKIKLLYDGDCPLCLREIRFLQKRDNNRGLVAFINIADDNYSPMDHEEIDYATAMGRIHAILPDGTIIKDLEVFQKVYEILGMGWVYAGTKLPIIGSIAQFIYLIWTKLRFPLSRRPNLATIVAQRQQKIANNVIPRCRLNQ